MNSDGSARRRVALLAGSALACVCAALAVVGTRPEPEAAMRSTTSSTEARSNRDRTPTNETTRLGEEGAVVAAMAAASAPQQWLYLTDDEIRSEVLELATRSAGPALADLTVRDIATARADLALSPGPVWWIVHPLATHVAAITSSEAEVEVWTATVLSAVDVAAPQIEFITVTVELVAEADRWAVASIRDRPGPTPALGPGDDPWDAAPFAEDLGGFTRLDGLVPVEVTS